MLLSEYDEKKVMDCLRQQYQEIGVEIGVEIGLERGEKRGLEKGLKKGRKEGLEKGRKEGREEGKKEGREQSREEGISILVGVLRDQGMPYDQVLKTLIESYQLDHAAAAAYMERYWLPKKPTP